jgi:hypothetical protein
MEAQPRLSGVRWSFRLRDTALRTGALTGIYLSCIFIAWLWIANYVPQLYSFAHIRNLSGGAAAIFVMAIPVLRFRPQPVKLFVSGVTAWTLLTLVYIAMEMHYSLLESRMGALHFFMLGAVSYGFVAVFQWVFLLCAETRHRHIAQTTQTAVSASRFRTH